jgi:hypothetical protein
VPDWAATKYKDFNSFLDGMKNLQSMTDKKVTEYESQINALKSGQAFPLEGLGARLDTEFAAGGLKDETKALLDKAGIDSSTLTEFIQFRTTKALEPVMSLVQGDPAANMKVFMEKADDHDRKLFRDAMDAGKHSAAAAVLTEVLTTASGKGAPLQVGQVGGNQSGGYKGFSDYAADVTNRKFDSDPEFRRAVMAKFNATPESVQSMIHERKG